MFSESSDLPNDRELQALLEKYRGAFRMDIVDYWNNVPTNPKVLKHLQPRDYALIAKLHFLSQHIPNIAVSGRDLQANLEGIQGKHILVVGSIRDQCCSVRAHFITQARGFPIVPYELTTII